MKCVYGNPAPRKGLNCTTTHSEFTHHLSFLKPDIVFLSEHNLVPRNVAGRFLPGAKAACIPRQSGTLLRGDIPNSDLTYVSIKSVIQDADEYLSSRLAIGLMTIDDQKIITGSIHLMNQNTKDIRDQKFHIRILELFLSICQQLDHPGLLVGDFNFDLIANPPTIAGIEVINYSCRRRQAIDHIIVANDPSSMIQILNARPFPVDYLDHDILLFTMDISTTPMASSAPAFEELFWIHRGDDKYPVYWEKSDRYGNKRVVLIGDSAPIPEFWTYDRLTPFSDEDYKTFVPQKITENIAPLYYCDQLNMHYHVISINPSGFKVLRLGNIQFSYLTKIAPPKFH